LAALSLAVGAPSLSAQTLQNVGAFAGVSRAAPGGGFIDLLKDVGGTVNPRYGFTLGGFASFLLAPDTHLRAELGVTQKGYRVPPDNGLRRRELDLTYVDLAGVVRRGFPVDGVSPWIGAGPVLSFRASANGRRDDDRQDVSDEVTGRDLGFALEAGATRNQVEFGIRYVLGLSDVTVSDDPDEEMKNRGVTLTVSYLVPR